MSVISHLDPRVASAFYGSFPKLREAQLATIEPLVSGANVVLSSSTGSGKTEAIVAPLISKYWKSAARSDDLFILYIAPTKALVNDLEKRLHQPFAILGLKVGIRHGDRDDLARGLKPHLLITTPESLDVMLFRKDSALRSIRAVVIDEVHLLYNTQRGLQLSILLRRLRKILPERLQWAALSATIGDLSYIRDFLMGGEEDAVFLNFPAQRVIDAHVRYTPTDNAVVDLIIKLTTGRPTKLLIFSNSRRECERLAEALQKVGALCQGVFAHYSSLSPEIRLETEQKFASMNTAICVATSTLELGIDIGDIDAVLLWGVPGSADSFLQRIGRSNRRSHKTNVVCFIPTDSTTVPLDALRFIALIDAARKGELPVQAPYDLFGAIGQQILSIIASDGGRFTRIADLCELVSHIKHLNREITETILAELASAGYLQRHGFKNQYGADENLHRLVDLKLIYGNFGVGSQSVAVYHGSKQLGDVPAINLMRLPLGADVRFAGKSWKIKKLSKDGIYLQPTPTSGIATDFTYGGSGITTDSFIANRVWQLIHSPDFPEELLAKDVRIIVANYREAITSACSFEQIPYLRSQEGIRYYTFGGYLINKAIGLVAKKPGFEADDISVLVSSPIDWSTIPTDPSEYHEFFPQLFEPSADQSLYQQQLPIELQRIEYLQEWLKDATISQILSRLGKGESKPIKSHL